MKEEEEEEEALFASLVPTPNTLTDRQNHTHTQSLLSPKAEKN